MWREVVTETLNELLEDHLEHRFAHVQLFYYIASLDFNKFTNI